MPCKPSPTQNRDARTHTGIFHWPTTQTNEQKGAIDNNNNNQRLLDHIPSAIISRLEETLETLTDSRFFFVYCCNWSQEREVLTSVGPLHWIELNCILCKWWETKECNNNNNKHRYQRVVAAVTTVQQQQQQQRSIQWLHHYQLLIPSTAAAVAVAWCHRLLPISRVTTNGYSAN